MTDLLPNIGVPCSARASINALLHWRPNMLMNELVAITDAELSFGSPNTTNRYRREIFATFIPNENGRTTNENALARFVQNVNSYKAQSEAVFYHLLKKNPALLEICLFLREQFDSKEVDRNALRSYLADKITPRGLKDTLKKAFFMLRDFGYVSAAKPEVLRLREPELESLAYIIFQYFMSVGSVAPSVQSIIENKYIRGSFFREVSVHKLLDDGSGRWWHRESRPPLDRIMLKLNSDEIACRMKR